MTPIDVITSCYQEGESDCTTIATIKTAIAKFGINNLFAASLAGGTWSVKFKDGTTLSVSDSDINSLKAISGFTLISDPANPNAQSIFDYAQFCFGIFVANYAQKNKVSIHAASVEIDNGINVFQDMQTPFSSYQYLGFNNSDVTMLTSDDGITDPATLSGNPVYLLCNLYHAVLASNAQYDEYGVLTNTNEFVRKHSKLFRGKKMWAYKFN